VTAYLIRRCGGCNTLPTVPGTTTTTTKSLLLLNVESIAQGLFGGVVREELIGQGSPKATGRKEGKEESHENPATCFPACELGLHSWME